MEKKSEMLNIAGTNSRIGNSILDTLCFYIVYLASLSFAASGFHMEAEENPFMDLILMIASYLLIFTLSEFLFQKTPGKILTRTKVVTVTGGKPDLKTIFIRTFCRLIPFEAFSFLFLENGIHDKFSNTRVIND